MSAAGQQPQAVGMILAGINPNQHVPIYTDLSSGLQYEISAWSLLVQNCLDTFRSSLGHDHQPEHMLRNGKRFRKKAYTFGCDNTLPYGIYPPFSAFPHNCLNSQVPKMKINIQNYTTNYACVKEMITCFAQINPENQQSVNKTGAIRSSPL